MFDRMRFASVVVSSAVAVFIAAVGVPPALGQCEVQLSASDAVRSDQFGSNISIDGDVAVIGGYGVDDQGDESGAAYVYRFDGSRWIEEAKLVACDGAAGDRFGGTVSISGNVVVIGASRNDDVCPMDPHCDSGSAYVFRFDGAKWIETTKLTASDAEAGDLFGSVSIRDKLIVIGAHGDDDACPMDPRCNSGAAYVFRFDGSNWIEEAKLTASDAAARDYFSAVSTNGEIVVIGARGVDEGEAINVGAAYVFRNDGNNWNEEVKLTASDGGWLDNFGNSVSIDGNVALIGAIDRLDMHIRSGAAYVFRFDGDTWNEEAKLTGLDRESGDYFGASVSVRSDVALIGAYGEDDSGQKSGAAYVFRYDGADWLRELKLTALDAEKEDLFGSAVFVTEEFALVGAHRNDDACPSDPNCNSGSVYVFDIQDCICTGIEKLKRLKCKEKNGRNKLTTKVVRGTPGGLFTIILDLGESAQGFLNDKGRGKATFVGLLSGPGEATATLKCGFPPYPSQRRSYECP